MLLSGGTHHLVAISSPAGIPFSCLTLRFHFEWIAAVVVATLQRFVEVIGAAGLFRLAATPVCRLRA